MTEHSKEPWKRDGDSVVDANGEEVFDVPTLTAASVVRLGIVPDIDLAIKCVNALAGLKPEKVKALVEAVRAWLESMPGTSERGVQSVKLGVAWAATLAEVKAP